MKTKWVYTIILKKKNPGGCYPLSFFQVQILQYLRWHPSKYFLGCRLKGQQRFCGNFSMFFSLFVYLLYKPPALFATCKVTRILSLPTPSILIPAQISMIWHNTMHCSVCLMKSFKSADPEYFIIERQLSKINVTCTIYCSCALKRAVALK